MRRTLNRDELEELIDVKMGEISRDKIEALGVLLTSAESWEDKMVGMNYLFSKILERRMGKPGINCKEIIDLMYGLQEEIWYEIREFDGAFIKYMLCCNINRLLSLEDNLTEIQDNMDAYQYGAKFRY